MKYPEFIIVSAYKAGSTALWYNLHKHPKIHMAKKKESVEMNFWKLQFYKRGHDWYKSFFPDEYICGERLLDIIYQEILCRPFINLFQTVK